MNNEGSPKGSLMWLVQLNAVHTYITLQALSIVLTRHFDSTIHNTISSLVVAQHLGILGGYQPNKVVFSSNLYPI